jgi:hypothetical protein
MSKKKPDGGNQPEPGAEEVFSDAFDTAENITPDKSKDVIPEGGDAPPVIDPPVDPPVVPPVIPDLEKPAAVIPKEKQQPGETDEAFEQRWRTLQGIYRHEKDEWKTEKEKITAELEELRKKVPQPAAENKDEGDSGLKELLAKLNLTDEQKAQLAEYDQEFDIVSRMEGLKRETAITKLKAEMLETFNGFRKEFQTQLEPATTLVKETAANKEEADKDAHFKYIRENHSDFEVYRDNGAIIAWIETKPAYQQKAMKLAYSQGTADDIVELLDGFKEENNIEKKGSVINIDKIKERKAALTPPVTRRGAVNASMAVATDFDGAFDEALNRT